MTFHANVRQNPFNYDPRNPEISCPIYFLIPCTRNQGKHESEQDDNMIFISCQTKEN